MKKIFASLFVLVALCSCDNETETPTNPTTPLTLTKADFSKNFVPNGTAYTWSYITPNATSTIAVPVNGDNQTWDFSNLEEESSANLGGTNFITPNNSAFSSATYGVNGTASFQAGGVPSNTVASTDFYKVNDNGFFYLGYSTNAPATISVPSLGLTINYTAQNIIYGTTGYPSLKLPATLGDSSVTTDIVSTSSYAITAPAFSLNNVPAQTKITETTTNTIVARGIAKLKNIGNVRVLVCKDSYSDKTNYFLNGAPAPATLLSNLGLTDGNVTTGVVYRIYGEGLGLVGYLAVDATSNKVTTARFRRG